MIAASEGMARLCFAAAGFILAAMAMVVFVWRDCRPRADTWQSIVRRDQAPTNPRDPFCRGEGPCTNPTHRHHTRSFEHRHYDTSEHDDDRIQ